MTSIPAPAPLASQQLDIFGDVSRLPRRPYCTDDLESGLRIRSLKGALSRRYIQVNPPHLRVFALFDIDRPGGGLAWEAVDLPPPTWSAVNRENGHAHLSWALTAPVLVQGSGLHAKPLKWLAAIEAGMRERLGGDPGFAGLITKNPASPFWRVFHSGVAYGLGELQEYLPDLPKHLPKRPAQQVGLGRNCSLFDWLRQRAYREVGGYKASREQGVYVQWLTHLYHNALNRNGDFQTPLDHREVHWVAKSVAKWTWNRYTGHGRVEVSPEVLSQVQSALGKLSGAKRRKGSKEEAKPWEVEGVSRRTWYRHKSGLILPD